MLYLVGTVKKLAHHGSFLIFLDIKSVNLHWFVSGERGVLVTIDGQIRVCQHIQVSDVFFGF